MSIELRVLPRFFSLPSLVQKKLPLPGHQATWEPDQCRERDKAGEPCLILEGRNCNCVYSCFIFFNL